MKALLAVASLVAVMALTKAQEVAPVVALDEPSSSNAEAAAVGAGDTSVICPMQWFCDSNLTWYPTRATCRASCSGACVNDYNCSLNCVCP